MLEPSLVFLLAQLILLGLTIYIPFRFRPRVLPFLLYTVVMFILWFAYMLGAMFLNHFQNMDVPGIGYLFLGFVGWVVGLFIVIIRRFRAWSGKWRYEIKRDNQ